MDTDKHRSERGLAEGNEGRMESLFSLLPPVNRNLNLWLGLSLAGPIRG